MEISVYRLAQALKVSRPRLNEIVLGRRGRFKLRFHLYGAARLYGYRFV